MITAFKVLIETSWWELSAKLQHKHRLHWNQGCFKQELQIMFKQESFRVVFFFPGCRLPARQMDMLSTQTLSVYNKWPCYLSFYLVNSRVIHVVAIWCETLSLCLPTQAQRGEICDAAAKLPHNGWLFSKRNHTLPRRERSTSSSVHPRGTIHWATDVEYLSSAIFTALRHTRTPTLRQVSGTLMGLKKKKKKPAGQRVQ